MRNNNKKYGFEDDVFDESFSRPNADPMVLNAYESLSNIYKRRLYIEANMNGEDTYSYLEELLIDYMNAQKIASDVIKEELIEDMPKSELAKLILYIGIGVQRRDPYEVAFITGGYVKKLNAEKEYLIDKYENSLEDIYDNVWEYVETSKSKEEKDIKRLEDIYNNLSSSQRDILRKLSKSKNEYDLDLLEEIIIDKENAIKLADEFLRNKKGKLIINDADLKYLLLYYGIGVTKRTPEEIYLLEKYPNAISLNSFVIYGRDLIVNSTQEIFSIYEEVMRILAIENKEEKDFNIR